MVLEKIFSHFLLLIEKGGCGLQNYMAYTQSVVYDRSGGRGKRSGTAVALATAGLYVVGPTIASFIPRCMAGGEYSQCQRGLAFVLLYVLIIFSFNQKHSFCMLALTCSWKEYTTLTESSTTWNTQVRSALLLKIHHS